MAHFSYILKDPSSCIAVIKFRKQFCAGVDDMFFEKIRWLLRAAGTIPFAGFSILLGGIYLGEQTVRSISDWTPVKVQIRTFTVGAYRPRPDVAVGFLDQPNLRQWVATSDFEYLAETDFWGFSNRVPWPGRVDVLFLGDSLITGSGVGIDRQFSSLVGRAFPDRTVLNLGIAGAAPNRQLRTYRKFGVSSPHRLVVSCIYLASDLDGELQFDAWLKEGAKIDYNSFRLSFGDKLHPKSFWTRVQRKCFLCGKMTELALRWTGFSDRLSFPTGQEVLLDIDKLRFLAEGLSQQDGRVASMLNSLQGIRALAESQGAQLLIMLIPSKEEIYGALSLPEVLKPVHVLEQRLREEKFSVLSVYDAVGSMGKERSPFFTRDIHLNGYGNQIVADRLVDWLRESKLPASDKTPAETSKSRPAFHKASS